MCVLSFLVSLFAAGPITAHGGGILLTGAGSTFAAPFLQRAFALYVHGKSLAIRYQAIGSGAGLQQFISNHVDFAVSDVPMNQLELALANRTGGPVEQAPVILGAVAIVYNEPNIISGSPLRLDASTLAAIFLGRITIWNDPAIAKLNPGVRLPPDHILAVHRVDSSGTTYILSDYLSTVSPVWGQLMGRGKAVAWPGGFRGLGSAGVTDWIVRHQGAIGYVELKYAIDSHLSYARIKNKAGVFVLPSQISVSESAAQFPKVTAAHFSIVNASGMKSYPISGYSWIVFHRHFRNMELGASLVKMIRWLATSGQRLAVKLNYAPLPAPIQRQDVATLAALHNG